MGSMNRRTFLASLPASRALLGAIPAGLGLARSARAGNAEIEIYLNEHIGTISPLLHGHFVEHIGGVVYDGVWVGPDSKVENIGGIRKALVDAMKPIGQTVVRWPGGCFADSYDWRDGTGPLAQRPKRTNFWANNGRLKGLPDSIPSKSEPNQFGTNEFIQFCRLIGADPYLAANLRSLTAKDFYQWVEYCNAPAGSTTLAATRGGEPFNVRYWGVGNESWGCGGDLTAAEYSIEFRKFAAWVPRYGDAPLSFIASGPNAGEAKWTHEFFQAIAAKSPALFGQIWGWALHYYTGRVGKGDSVDFTPGEAYELINRSDRMESLIRETWDLMGETDTAHKVKLVVDEWGTWANDDTAVAPHHLFGSVQTMRDAIVAGLTLDTFQRHADKVAMANVAQLLNNIQTLFLADADRFCVTPTYHVFRMYRDHRNGLAVRSQFAAPRIGYSFDTKTRDLVGLAGSASVNGNVLTVTAVNTGLTDQVESGIRVVGGSVTSAAGTVLTGPDVHAHNDFSGPDRVKPAALAVRGSGGELQVTIPAASVVKISAKLG